MKLTNILGLLLVAGASSQQAFAQYEGDALKFSGTESSTTARFGALGGQQTSMGGDLSSIYGNPAGLGMFSRSEFAFTVGLNNYKNKSEFLGQSTSSSVFNPTINNIGIVFHSPVSKFGDNTKKGLVAVNYGIGYQKNNFFKNKIRFSGVTFENGLGDYLAEAANRDGASDPEKLSDNIVYGGWQGYLFDQDNTGKYAPNTYSDGDQNMNILRSGGQSNLDLSFGLNFGNNVYVGAGVGIASLNYKSQETLNESSLFADNGSPYNVDFLKSYNTEGSGVNFKIGAILKPVNELRLGLSLETPTYYDLTDTYYERIDFLNTFNTSVSQDQDFNFNYNLRTPLKLNGGISYIFGQKGFISADVNFVDYSTIKFTSNESATDRNVNNYIQNNYKDVVNFGVGAEYKVSNEFAVRAGYRHMGDPYVKSSVDNSVNRYSGGFGYRVGNYSIDAAVMVYDNKDGYSAYTLSGGNEPYADITKTTTRVSLTFGARF
ncbi:membrane protein involved in aromatic hydrocarbon degradation [Pseudopedobacter saltans DSM 12145]|uniref:Membrane protein involved in aromatic hydrocarbon degradation n=1 Tax=Pseudopedobacter saltans (strain ATCC 51119 / DSM 12145 / JCM 21818 / CCUG 39354 / LMG 10337 / NBRC 100064 / NCIMB 13643) TaxID=762903 RepID=F0S5S5_PSESL|nr:outer membrane protein transport protein [Pseudopedobacter saltans]ADY50996.1 membrane protein involved in aromatic hydrocarbon degradation [Pseudopedobacter saltans DSM 12145]